MTQPPEEPEREDPADEPESITGPHGWLNWWAERHGYPRRTEAHPDSVLIRPIWQEFALYSDVRLDGGWLTTGPYEFLIIDRAETSSLGRARKLVLLRAWDHLPDGPPRRGLDVDDDVVHYFGGDIGDEMAALLGLALGRRFRSGGQVRQGLPDLDPLGMAGEDQHQAPALEPPHRRGVIASLAQAVALADAAELLNSYPAMGSLDAVALVRAARQYVDGLWLADADPRLAWIKFIGALEVCANRFDDTREETEVEQLKRHRPTLYRDIRDQAPDLLEAVAAEFARLYNIERKVWSFVKRFDPGPPQVRPQGAGWHFDWAQLDRAMAVIYQHRSRDLHDGIAFPWPLCEPPHVAEDGVPAEFFPALGVSGRGGRWTAESLPMYLHVFEHLVGGALRSWWSSKAPHTPPEDRGVAPPD